MITIAMPINTHTRTHTKKRMYSTRKDLFFFLVVVPFFFFVCVCVAVSVQEADCLLRAVQFIANKKKKGKGSTTSFQHKPLNR